MAQDCKKEFRKAVTIFLDILGSQDRKDFSEWHKVMSIFSDTIAQEKQLDSTHPHTIYKREIHVFSDCAYIIYDYKPEIEESRKDAYIQTQLFPDNQGVPLSEDELTKDRLAVQSFLQIDIETFSRWYDFLACNESHSKVIFHTYHSTKGREFDNVLIFMTAKFGTDHCFFSDLLSAFSANTPAAKDTDKIGAARNLFYVAVTRAVKNLCVVYLVNDGEDIPAATASLGKVFSDVKSDDFHL